MLKTHSVGALHSRVDVLPARSCCAGWRPGTCREAGPRGPPGQGVLRGVPLTGRGGCDWSAIGCWAAIGALKHACARVSLATNTHTHTHTHSTGTTHQLAPMQAYTHSPHIPPSRHTHTHTHTPNPLPTPPPPPCSWCRRSSRTASQTCPSTATSHPPCPSSPCCPSPPQVWACCVCAHANI